MERQAISSTCSLMRGENPLPSRNHYNHKHTQWHDIMAGGGSSNNSVNGLHRDDDKKAKEVLEQVRRSGLECPRCQSANTKFSYFNNYSKTQPRYFCKSCRRYWTHGGSLRSVPVGRASHYTSERLYVTAFVNRPACRSIPRNTTAIVDLQQPTPPITTTDDNNNLDLIRHLGAEFPFPAASISACNPSTPPPAHSPSIVFPDPSYLHINHQTSDLHNAGLENLPLFRTSESEDDFPPMSTSEGVAPYCLLDQLELAGEVNGVSPYSQQCKVDHELLDAYITSQTPFCSSSTEEVEYIFDAYDNLSYCFSDLWIMPTEFHT